MWVVIYVAKGIQEADKVNKLLEENGFLTKLHKVGRSQSEAEGLFEISVPEVEASEVQEIVCRGGY